jgi:EAL domain-containing protein (putative c-di-GMP-specific phosphodiesterase class I)/PAS domain-containing protein/GGDEF domain-containing protein
MSAQLSQHVTTRLLIAEKSENSAHELDSSLRDAGIATKLIISDDLAHIGQLMADGEADIALLTDKLDGLDQQLPRLREIAPHMPILLLTHTTFDDDVWPVARAIELGATDVVPAANLDQLALVVKRELAHVCSREHFSQVRRALTEAEQRCQLLLQGSKAAIAYVHEGMHIHANEGYLDLFGFTDVDDLCAESLIDILAPDSATELKTHFKTLRNGAEETVLNFVSNDRTETVVSGTMTLANSQYEGEDCLQVTVRPQADHSSDTKQANDAPAAETSQAQDLELPGFVKATEAFFTSSPGCSYLLIAGLDHFGEIQRAYGLVGAETICRKVWHQITEIACDYPTARVNNHQFAIAVSADSFEKVTTLGEQICASVSELMFEVHDKTVRPTVAVTGAEFNEARGVSKTLDEGHGNFLDMLEKDASNVVQIPSNEEDEEGENGDARLILRQITEAIEKKNFLLLFQPIISLRGDSDEHYEVFLRMTNDSGQQIQPAKFLQPAIDNNVAGKIDRWVILQSIKMLSVHRAKGHATRLTINLTCNSVTDPEFLQWLSVAIKAARLPSDAVIFQITEKDATTYLRQTREFIEGLRNMHCRASLSRFGLIEDPFETLRHLQVDMVKLDGSCISSIDGDEEKSAELIENIKKLQGSGKLTVVPMVENANVLSTLWQAGANYIQGHYMQEPSTDMNYDFSTEE